MVLVQRVRAEIHACSYGMAPTGGMAGVKVKLSGPPVVEG